MTTPVTKKFFVTKRWSTKMLEAVINMKEIETDVIFGLFFQDPRHDNYAMWVKAQAAGIAVVDLVPTHVGIFKLTDKQREALQDTCLKDAATADDMMTACEAMKFSMFAALEASYKFSY